LLGAERRGSRLTELSSIEDASTTVTVKATYQAMSSAMTGPECAQSRRLRSSRSTAVWREKGRPCYQSWLLRGDSGAARTLSEQLLFRRLDPPIRTPAARLRLCSGAARAGPLPIRTWEELLGASPAVREGGDGQAMEGEELKSTGEEAWSMVVATMWSATVV
jgi:hypothetical protein